MFRWHRQSIASVIALTVFLVGCETPSTSTGAQNTQTGGVSSTGQTGGVTAGTIGSVTLPSKIKSPFLAELQNRYYEGSILLNRWRALSSDATDADVKGLIQSTNDWEGSTYKWISVHITPAAAERFQQWNPVPMSFVLPGKHPADLGKAYENSLILIPQWLANLDALMRSDDMYPQ